MATPTKRRSRFKTEPRTDKPHFLTPKDAQLLRPLLDYQYLPSTYLRAFADDETVDYVPHRLTILRHDLGVIAVPPASLHAANARYRPSVYSLTPKGIAALADRGHAQTYSSIGQPFAHEFGACLTRASFELGAREKEFGYITHTDILAAKMCPSETKRSRHPFEFPVTFDYETKDGTRQLTKNTRHDAPPFGIMNPRTDRRVFVPGIEFDRATEPLTAASDSKRSSVQKHLSAILQALSEGRYRDHYGIYNSVILFVTISESRMRGIMDELGRLTIGRGSKQMLITHISDFASFEKLPAPSGRMLTQKWERVGHEPFDFIQALEGR